MMPQGSSCPFRVVASHLRPEFLLEAGFQQESPSLESCGGDLDGLCEPGVHTHKPYS